MTEPVCKCGHAQSEHYAFVVMSTLEPDYGEVRYGYCQWPWKFAPECECKKFEIGL